MNKGYFRWPPEAEEMLKALKIEGYTAREISGLLSGFHWVEP